MKSRRSPASSNSTSTASSATTSQSAMGVSNAAVASGVSTSSSSQTPLLDTFASNRHKPRGDGETVSNPSLNDEQAGKYSYEEHEGPAFMKGEGDKHAVDAEDVKQGSLGDCYWIAAMAAVAKADPDAIKDLIKDNGDGTYDVTLYSYGQPQTITVDDHFPTKSSGSMAFAKHGDEKDGKKELWPALLEKAYAIKESKWGGDGYEKIEGGMPGNAMEVLTGKSGSEYDPRNLTEEEIAAIVTKALENDIPISCATLVEDDVKKAGVEDLMDDYGAYACHCYTFYGIDGDTLKLRNPWGDSHPKDMPISVFKQLYDVLDVNDGD